MRIIKMAPTSKPIRIKLYLENVVIKICIDVTLKNVQNIFSTLFHETNACKFRSKDIFVAFFI